VLEKHPARGCPTGCSSIASQRQADVGVIVGRANGPPPAPPEGRRVGGRPRGCDTEHRAAMSSTPRDIHCHSSRTILEGFVKNPPQSPLNRGGKLGVRTAEPTSGAPKLIRVRKEPPSIPPQQRGGSWVSIRQSQRASMLPLRGSMAPVAGVRASALLTEQWYEEASLDPCRRSAQRTLRASDRSLTVAALILRRYDSISPRRCTRAN